MKKPHLIITSIASDTNPVLRHYAEKCAQHSWNFLVVGDTKSPTEFSLSGCSFLSIENQRQLKFNLAKLLPYKHYARKNLGYLQAMQQGASIIVETDDDNWSMDSFWQERKNPEQACLCEEDGWINIYRNFTDAHIWPRGFALEQIQNIPAEFGVLRPLRCPIQQGLADSNPDVDAIYRLTLPLPIKFKNDSPPLALGQGAICPFNSQNTTWFSEAFLLLYLPSYCSFRMTDIWRSFVAQRLAWTCGWNILFHSPTVWQERNEHNLMRDFAEEISGYQNNLAIMEMLNALDLTPGPGQLSANLVRCYQALVEAKLVGAHELALLDAWISDVHSCREQFS